MKLYLKTFGCRANQYDTEAVRALAVAAGCEIVEHPSEADTAVFNSCTVTAAAEADLRQSIRRAARERPGLRSIVIGCAAARSAAGLRQLPSVDHVLPGADLESISEALVLPVPAMPGGTVRTRSQTGARALLRIQDGCNEHCTFCATTLARGPARSRPVKELIAEARLLATRHQEIVITGIHIGHYGSDTGSSLALLVEALMRQVEGVRFRLTSLEATEVDDRMRAMLRAASGQLAPHLHAPLQSGSDRILKLMGRNWYTSSRYRQRVEEIVQGLDVFALGADIICGFPGESDADFEKTLEVVRDLPFTYLHVFQWSERAGTAASRLPGRVPARVAAARSAELRSLAASKAESYHRQRDGGSARIVLLTGGPNRTAMTEDYLTVSTDARVGRGTMADAILRLGATGLRAEVHGVEGNAREISSAALAMQPR